MEKVSRYRENNPLATLLAAAPIGVLRPATLSDTARQTLLRQSSERLALLQKEWASKCEILSKPYTISNWDKTVRGVSYGVVAAAAASFVWPGPSLEWTGAGLLSGACLLMLRSEKLRGLRVQQVLDQSNAQLASGDTCLKLKDQIADAEVVIAELNAGPDKAPAPVAFTPTVPALTPSVVARLSLTAAISGALVYACKTAASGVAAFAASLTPRSVLENLGSEHSSFL